jgi:predicted NUDIX family NTP pyrophosphohydrolase
MPPRKTSAGLLLYRRRPGAGTEVLLVHPGGPFYAGKDEGIWSVPKGEPAADEPLLAAARREFREETGFPTADAPDAYLPLGEVVQRSGKVVTAFAFEGDCDPAAAVSDTFELEWPPGSGRKAAFPEVDRAAFFAVPKARRAILPAQVPFLDRLEAALAASRT